MDLELTLLQIWYTVMEEPYRITEFLAMCLAFYAIPIGIGATALNGYRRGKCLLPPYFVYHVNTVLGVAMALRVATFIIDGRYYIFLITVDVIGFILAIVIFCQARWGLFLRKEEQEDAP